MFFLHHLWFGYFVPSLWGNGPEALVQTVVYGIIAVAIVPRLRKDFESGMEDLHAKLDHIIFHHPDIPPFLKAGTVTTPLSANVTGGIRNFGMLGNDTDGDCVDAAVEHITMCKSVQAASKWKHVLYRLGFKPPSTKYTLGLYAQYLATLGEKPGPDTGVDPGGYLAWLLAQGLITSWGIVPLSGVNQAIIDYRGVLAAVALTHNAAYNIGPNGIWIVGPDSGDTPNPNYGHGIALVEYTPTTYTCVTWGYLQKLSLGFLQLCAGPQYGACFVFTTTEDEARLGTAAYNALVAATNALPRGD